MRPLEELSYAELMELFPIALVPHRDEWREQYARERERLLTQLPEDAEMCIRDSGKRRG